MRMWAAKNFIFTSLHILLCANCYFIVFYFHYYYANYYYYYFFFIICLSSSVNPIVIQIYI